ncbi:MAG TPA: hydroxymethylbilane synthase [Vicinamibacterales bacterium]|jgi:hydroxymethylbilane synthase|nr:hydroxymethylbilane synthase [Vicinamibacterales bacterium]
MILRVGTRGSELALYQANAVAEQLRVKAGVDCEIVTIKTSGDRLAEATLTQIGGKRLFVKEIEDALLAGEVDIAVHSSKDMPAVLPDGLVIAGVLPREDARDAVVLPGRTEPMPLERLVSRLGANPRLGTSSVRRIAQLARLFPGATFQPIRGNLGTRLRKLDEGQYDAIVLASAGLIRLEGQARISTVLPTAACVPAPGQGIIAIEIRSNDPRAADAVRAIDDPASRAALDAERAVVTRLGGGCQMPIGAHAEIAGNEMSLVAVVLSLDGAQAIRAESRGLMADALKLGQVAADDLLSQGAGEILTDVERTHAAVEGIQP